jgi:predicted MPP superfamily phosphohydrolase
MLEKAVIDYSKIAEGDTVLVVITGNILDRHISSLPDMVRGLVGIRSSLGAFAVLGNHDISSDRYSYSTRYQGGINITQGLESIGIRTLRNEVVYLRSQQDRVALLGLDWLGHGPGSRNFYAYQQILTQQQLRRLAAEAGPETPRILLAHHPDTFADALPYEIGLTLAGHTHGGGQVILGSVDKVPIGLGIFRFQYLSGLYQEQGCSLYVNRGIGYLGIPIRINCPPEISRFKLVRV